MTALAMPYGVSNPVDEAIRSANVPPGTFQQAQLNTNHPFFQQGNPFAQMLQQNPINQQGNPLAQLLQMFSGGFGGQPNQPIDWSTANRTSTQWGLPIQNQLPFGMQGQQQQTNPLMALLGLASMSGGLSSGFENLNRTTPVLPTQPQPLTTKQDWRNSIPGAGTVTDEALGRPKPGTLADWKLRNGY